MALPDNRNEKCNICGFPEMHYGKGYDAVRCPVCLAFQHPQCWRGDQYYVEVDEHGDAVGRYTFTAITGEIVQSAIVCCDCTEEVL